MSRYFFHLRNGADLLLDPEGRELAETAISSEALAQARSMISHDVLDGQVSLDQHIDVWNAAGQIVHTLCFGDALVIAGRSRQTFDGG